MIPLNIFHTIVHCRSILLDACMLVFTVQQSKAFNDLSNSSLLKLLLFMLELFLQLKLALFLVDLYNQPFSLINIIFQLLKFFLARISANTIFSKVSDYFFLGALE